MIQEQISAYLGITSFKRKYPGGRARVLSSLLFDRWLAMTL